MRKMISLVVLLTLSIAAPAAATVVTFTDQIFNIDGLPLGLSDANALGTPVDIGVASIEVLPVDFSVVAATQGTIFANAAAVPNPLVESPSWTLTNNSPDTNIVDLQLVFVTYRDTSYTVGGQQGMTNYDDPLGVGFDVDAGDGWFVYNVDRGMGFEPIFLLTLDVGTIVAGASTQIVVPHWLSPADGFLGDDERFNLVLPTIELMGVYELVKVPEPATALLVSLGIGMLGVAGRRRV